MVPIEEAATIYRMLLLAAPDIEGNRFEERLFDSFPNIPISRREDNIY
jgi:hypothetical protein